MNTAFPSFPYSVDDEPTADWTTEHVLQWYALKAIAVIDQARAQRAEAIDAEAARDIAQPRESHEQAQASSQEEAMNIAEDENMDPQSTEQPTDEPKSVDGAAYTQIVVVIESGPYLGEIFVLKPTKKCACFVGRSQGKNFREKGISLSKDSEVSGFHGAFLISANGCFYYADNSSTNGSRLNGESLKAHMQVEIKNGDEILVGETRMRISLQ